MPNLIFIDESSPESPNYSQISGFVISIENYVLLRSEIIRDHISSKAINNQNQSFEPCDIPCYKWSEFLKKDAVNDECKYRKLDYLLSVLYTKAQWVFCYGVHGPLPFENDRKKFDKALQEMDIPGTQPSKKYRIKFPNLRFCWGQLQHLINRYQTDDVLIPVVDLGLSEGFSSLYYIYYKQNYMALNSAIFLGEKSVTLENPQNCLEPFFAEDESSIGVQLADIVGGFKLFNGKLPEKPSEYKTSCKKMLEKWITNSKTTCLFESWEKNDSGYQASYHDSVHNGKAYNGKEETN